MNVDTGKSREIVENSSLVEAEEVRSSRIALGTRRQVRTKLMAVLFAVFGAGIATGVQQSKDEVAQTSAFALSGGIAPGVSAFKKIDSDIEHCGPNLEFQERILANLATPVFVISEQLREEGYSETSIMINSLGDVVVGNRYNPGTSGDIAKFRTTDICDFSDDNSTGEDAKCTGFEIEGASMGKPVFITAAHCVDAYELEQTAIHQRKDMAVLGEERIAKLDDYIPKKLELSELKSEELAGRTVEFIAKDNISDQFIRITGPVLAVVDGKILMYIDLSKIGLINIHGTSGAPLIDMETGHVVGVLSGGTDEIQDGYYMGVMFISTENAGAGIQQLSEQPPVEKHNNTLAEIAAQYDACADRKVQLMHDEYMKGLQAAMKKWDEEEKLMAKMK